MLNTNNIVNYEINIKQKEKKYSLTTVLAWLYLKTIGRILPERWNKWAENILYYDKFTMDDGAQTNACKAVDLKPKTAAKGIQSESKGTQCTATQTEGLITIDKSVQIDLKPEAAEENNEIMSEDEGIYSKASNELTDEDSSDIEMNNENELAWKNDCEMHKEVDEELNEQLEDVSHELELECSHNAFLKETNINLESQLRASYEDLVKATETIAHLEEKITVASEENKQLKLQLLKYEEDYVELRDISNKIEKEFSFELEEMREEIKKNLLEIRKKDDEINALIVLSKELEQDKKAMNDKNQNLQTQVTKLKDKIASEVSSLSNEKETLQLNVSTLTTQLQSAQKSKQQLEKEKIDLEDKLKDSSNKLSAAEIEKKELENKITNLQEQVQILEKGKEWESAGIDDSLKETSLNLTEMLKEALAKTEKQIEQLQEEHKQAENQSKIDITKLQEEKKDLLTEMNSLKENLSIMAKQLEQQQLLNNQELLELKKEKRDVDTELENINKKTKEQTKTKAPDTVSIAKSTTKSILSKLSNKIFRGKNLNSFLSDKNEKLKENFPEFQGKHFCHNALGKAVESLSNQNDGKFESNKLLKLLESHLTKSAREIIEAEVKGIVEKYCDIGNIDKELCDGVLKNKLLPSVKKCMKKLSWNEKGATATTDSILQSFPSKNNTSNDLLKKIVVKGLVEGRMKFFSINIQSLQLASSIRDKFLSPDQKMCSYVPGEGNTYQLSSKKPNSLISNTNIASLLNNQRDRREC